MGLAKFRADAPRRAFPNGSVEYVTLWGGGPSLAQIKHCPVKLDGQDHPARTAYIQGEADTYFSIPAAICVRGKRVSGFVMFETGQGFTFYNDRAPEGESPESQSERANMQDTARVYQLYAALVAGRTLGSFTSQEQAQMFYDATNGPLPLARSMFADERLQSVFVQSFLEAFHATGFLVMHWGQ